MICTTKLASKKTVPVCTFPGVRRLPISLHGCQCWKLLVLFCFVFNLCQFPGWDYASFLFAFIWLVTPHIFMYVLYIYRFHLWYACFVPFFVFLKKYKGEYKGKNDVTNIQIPTAKNEQVFTFYHICFLALILGN